MTEPENRKHGIGYWCCWAVLSFVLYVGSLGPVACVLVAMGEPPWTQNVVTAVYLPVMTACALSPTCHNGIQAYLKWWYQLVRLRP